jgi:methyltransferase-like protein
MNILELFHQKSKFATRYIGTELMIVPIKNSVADMNELYTLNEVGSFIWELINGENTIDDIINAIVNEYNVDKKTAQTDLTSFIQKIHTLTSN